MRSLNHCKQESNRRKRIMKIAHFQCLLLRFPKRLPIRRAAANFILRFVILLLFIDVWNSITTASACGRFSLFEEYEHHIQVQGEITYNGHRLDEFVPQKTSTYIIQNDVHIGEMIVKETLDFSTRCQGVGSRYDLLVELAKREKEVGIFPEAEVDLFMKATAMEGVESNMQTDYTLRNWRNKIRT